MYGFNKERQNKILHRIKAQFPVIYQPLIIDISILCIYLRSQYKREIRNNNTKFMFLIGVNGDTHTPSAILNCQIPEGVIVISPLQRVRTIWPRFGVTLRHVTC